MTQLFEDRVSVVEANQLKRLKRKNRIVAALIGLFALTMALLSYLMFSRYEFIPYK